MRAHTHHECRPVPNPPLPTARSPAHEAKLSLPAQPLGPRWAGSNRASEHAAAQLHVTTSHHLSPPLTTYVRGPVLSDALDGVGCMLALRSRFEPCRLTSELRSSSNCLCTTSSKRRSCIHVSRLGQ